MTDLQAKSESLTDVEATRERRTSCKKVQQEQQTFVQLVQVAHGNPSGKCPLASKRKDITLGCLSNTAIFTH